VTTTRALTINGEPRTVAVEPGQTLLDVLRDALHLTGTKKGCNVGDCGVCTVLVDGEPMNSCLLLASAMASSAASAPPEWSSPQRRCCEGTRTRAPTRSRKA
jgi:aerobic-type carbon monoxide dehydrogenase small subunit (CoxS/CutS family)